MAQIIQHKRGVLENLAGASPNKAELLVVTGSSISALADGLVFVGNSNSDVTAVNRIITGSSTPNVTGGAYNHFVDGIPFYNTSDKQLVILGKNSNTNVELAHGNIDFKGSGVLSGSVESANDNTITVAVAGGLTVSADADFTLNQNSDQTITIGTNGSGFVSSSAQSVAHITGGDLDMGGNKVLFGNVYSTLGDLPNASTYHGMFAHVHGTGHGYFAHGGNWIKLQNYGGLVSGSSQISVTNAIVASNAAIAHTKIDFNGSGLQSGSGDISSVVAGAGLTGGGTTGDVTLNVVGGDGITANADEIIVDATVLRTNSMGVISGSAQLTSDFDTRYINTNSDGVVSGSSQIQLGSASGNVALGSQTTGNYVATLGSGTGVTIGSNTGEGSTPTIAVDYGADANTAVQGNTSLTVQGTTNEIEVSGGSITLGDGGTVTVGLPNDVTIGNDLTVTRNVAITGDLTVSGTTTTVDSETINISGSLVQVNYGGGAVNGGLQVTDKTGSGLATGSLLYNGTNDYWVAGPKDSEKRIIVEGGSAGTANKVSKFDAAGTIVNSTITDDGTNVSLTGELTVDGLVANSFVVTNGSKQLLEVTPSTAGDIVQWNGSAFAASNVIDGGSF